MIYDVILIAFIALSVFFGIRKGAAKTLLSLIAIILALIIAILLSKPLSDFTFETFFRQSLEKKVSDSITDYEAQLEEKAAEFEAPVSDMYLKAMEYFGSSDENIENKCEELISIDGQKAAPKIVDLFKPVITGFIAVIIAILLFIVLAIVLNFLAKPLSIVFRLPFINLADRAAGGIIGFLRGVSTISTLAFILNLLAPFIPADTFFFGSESVSRSYIFSFIYNGGLSDIIQSFIYNI